MMKRATIFSWLISLSAMAPAALGQASASVNLGIPVEVPTGDAAEAIVAGDWNGDGSVDLAVANRDAATISILRNSGIGIFVVTQTLLTGTNSRPFALVAGDFDADGTLDLAAAIEGTDQVALMIGNGTGAFANPVFTLVGDSPRDLASGNFDKANGLDLVVVNEDADTATVLLNDNTGVFSTTHSLDVIDPAANKRARPKGVAVGDFDKDGNLDIAVANFAQNQVAVLFGAGDGTFGDLHTFDTAPGGDPWAIAAADLNTDGNLDLVVANSLTDNVSILIGDGAGAFAAHVEYATGNRPQDVIAADVNSDGTLDLVTANFEGDSISVLTGKGDGTFNATKDSPTGKGPNGVVAGDFNGDAKVDVATANEESDNAAILLATLATANNNNGSTDGATLTQCPGAACGPLGLTPLAVMFCGIWGLKRVVRHQPRARR